MEENDTVILNITLGRKGDTSGTTPVNAIIKPNRLNDRPDDTQEAVEEMVFEPGRMPAKRLLIIFTIHALFPQVKMKLCLPCICRLWTMKTSRMPQYQ